jgi:nucleoside-diphosphate-sugar epimerase
MTGTLLTLGHGYCATALADRLLPTGWQILGTARTPEGCSALAEQGITPVPWRPDVLKFALSQASHVLVSAGPKDAADPSLEAIGPALAERAKDLEWVGYLSTTGVYGDQDGAWIDEDCELRPSTKRGQSRLRAEQAWQAIPDLPLHIFRLAGIYGPGRGPFAKVRNGTARRIIKPDQVFSRIHVEDIAQVLHTSMLMPEPGDIFNVCDDEPAPPQDVIQLAAELLNLPVPPAVPIDEVEMTPMARSFYSENKRVSNKRLKEELGIELKYPDYRVGLKALLAQETADE